MGQVHWQMLPLLFLRIGMVTLGVEVAARYFFWYGMVRDAVGEDGRSNPLAVLVLCGAVWGLGLAVLGTGVLIFAQMDMTPPGIALLGTGSLLLNGACILGLFARSLIEGVSRPDILYRFVIRTLVALAGVPIVLYLHS